MAERSEPLLKIACLVLAILLAFQVARVVIRHNPVAQMNIPPLPTLPESTNSSASNKGTNATPAPTTGKKDTNAAAMPTAGKAGTNSHENVEKKDTNSVSAHAPQKVETNSVVADDAEKKTNAIAVVKMVKEGTNKISGEEFGKMGANTNTNGVTVIAAKIGTNATSERAAMKGKTNGMQGKMAGRRGGGFSPGQMGGAKLPDLPPIIQGRIDKITQSEIFAQLMRPQPLALVGIAGNSAILRAPSGQTGLVKEGGELGGIKLIRIGVNRVLVEEEGQQKELTIFAGIGGDTLIPKTKEANESISKTP